MSLTSEQMTKANELIRLFRDIAQRKEIIPINISAEVMSYFSDESFANVIKQQGLLAKNGSFDNPFDGVSHSEPSDKVLFHNICDQYYKHFVDKEMLQKNWNAEISFPYAVIAFAYH
jgi:hypothetical protein